MTNDHNDQNVKIVLKLEVVPCFETPSLLYLQPEIQNIINMKCKLNIIKQIVTPIEIEADDVLDAVEIAFKLIPDIDTNHGKVGYMVDTIPSSHLMNWHKEESK